MCKGGQCIDHAHIHALLSNLDISADLRKQFSEHKISKIDQLKRQALRGFSYLFFGRHQ